ncbi:MAG: addiction module protein [Verrucomicrobiales bacterium]|nr:addiction module protein [Verrucomicrobiales bacterium]
MSKFSTADVLELPVQERLQLVEDIWNSIADVHEALELSDEDKKFIDARLEARQRNPNAGSPWEEVYARITSNGKSHLPTTVQVKAGPCNTL